MMHNMIGGFGSFFILWMLIGMLFCIVVLGGVIWLIGHWLNKKTPTMPNTPQPQNFYQGYQPPQQTPVFVTLQDEREACGAPINGQKQRVVEEHLPQICERVTGRLLQTLQACRK